MDVNRPVIGIDLGTNYCRVGVWQNGRFEVIPDEQENRTMASCVAFTEKTLIIGHDAKKQFSRNPHNTIIDIKKLLGQRFDDINIPTADKLQFNAICNDGEGKAQVEVEFKGGKKRFMPEEICALILRKIKQTAETYLGQKVEDAVITVPACFNYYQRQATIDAATIAGLHVLRVVNDASIAGLLHLHMLNNEGVFVERIENERNAVIVDLGAGTLSVSVMSIGSGIIEVKSTAGHMYLGGNHFDNRMVHYFCNEFKTKFNKDLTTNARALCRLQKACEQAKRTLSSAVTASIEIDSLHEGIDFFSSITRARFEEICADLFRATLEPVEKALRDAKMDKSEIHHVRLVGGSSKIPRVQKLFKDFFEGKEFSHSMYPEESVVCGSAMLAAILVGDKSESLQDLLLLEVTPISLGVETEVGKMTTVIKRNTTIPSKQTETYTISTDNQLCRLRDVSPQPSKKPKVKVEFESKPIIKSEVTIKIYEGENEMTKDNNFLGSLTLAGIILDKEPQIAVTFDIDPFQALNITARDQKTAMEVKVCINDELRLNNQQIHKMKMDSEKYSKEEREYTTEVFQARNNLEKYIFELKQTVETVKEKCEAELKRLCDTPGTKRQYQASLKEFKDQFETLVKKARGQGQGQGCAPSSSTGAGAGEESDEGT